MVLGGRAFLHLPFLLRLACGAIDVDSDHPFNSDGAEEMDVTGGMFAPTAEEIEAETARPSLLTQTSGYWDHFLEWTRDIETPWTDDSDEYTGSNAPPAVLQW